MTDVSAGFRPPCWCPCTWAPAWRLHTNLYKFGENVSLHIFHEKNCCDLNLGESLCICTFFLFPDSGLNLLNGFVFFLFWSILNGVTLKTSNCACAVTQDGQHWRWGMRSIVSNMNSSFLAKFRFPAREYMRRCNAIENIHIHKVIGL